MPRLVSWKECTTSRSDLDSPRPIDSRDRSARKRRNLHRGVLRWIRDICAADLLPTSERRTFHRVMLFSLTCADVDQDPARGEMQRLMHDYRYVNPGGRYVWWVEYQLRGSIHFHGMLVDPPIEAMRAATVGAFALSSRRQRGFSAGAGTPTSARSSGNGTIDIAQLDGIGVVRKWLDAHWHLAGIQSWCQWRSADWFRRSAGAYALKDVRKLNGKQYEQKYDRMPERWRVYARSDLLFTDHDHRLHEDTGVVQFTFTPVEWSLSGNHVEVVDLVPVLVSIAKHVPAIGGCRLISLRRSRRGARARSGSRPPPRGRDRGRRSAGRHQQLRGSPTGSYSSIDAS